MSTVEKSVEVDVPVSTSYNQWTQFESFPEFMDGVESITQLSDTRNHWVVKVGAALNFDQRQVDKSAEDFKTFIESRGAESGGWRGDVTGGTPTS